MLRVSPEDHPFYEVSWKISNKCNFNCPYCVRVLKKDDEEPDYINIAIKINDFFNKEQPENGQLYITGGEPFLWPLETLFDGILTSPYLKLVRVTSNMSLPTERYLLARRLLESNGKSFLLKGSLHQTRREDQIAFIRKCKDAKVNCINIVCNDDNYVDYLLLLQNFNFDGDKTITVDGYSMSINWMVERLTGGGVPDNVRTIPRKSRTFQISEYGCNCSAGQTTLRVEPNGDIKRCFSTGVIGNVKKDDLKISNEPYHCTRKICSGCMNVWVYDRENINFIYRGRRAEQIRQEGDYE